MTTAINSTIDNLNTNKRKFISDDEVYPPSARILSNNNQIETSLSAKKFKCIDSERLPSTIIEEEDDDMMICDNSNSDINSTHTTNISQAVISSKHNHGIHNIDASPPILSTRCYCDPFRLNSFVPYDVDIY